MGDPTTVLGVLAAILAVASFVLFVRMKQSTDRASQLEEQAREGRSALDTARRELSESKDELSKRQKQLKELKEEAKKKARREGKKEARRVEPADKAELSDDVVQLREEIKKQKKVIAGLQQQVEQTQAEAQRTVSEAEKIARDNVTGELQTHRDRANKLDETLRELRASIKKQREARPDVPGTEIDLKALEPKVVQELARYYRKSEEFEKLYSVIQGQLQLERDKVADLERRYLAVCRELAVAASTDGVDDSKAKELAEAVVAQSDAAAKPVPRGAAAPGDPKKKRRRRRRRGKKGEGEGEGGDDTMAAGGEASPHDGTGADPISTDEVKPEVAAEAMAQGDAAVATAEG